MTGSVDPDIAPRAALDQALARGALPAGAAVLVALSGGRDSASLLHAMQHLGAWRLSALTVDHRLHPDSAAHARRASAFARSLGVPTEITAVECAVSGSGPEAAARRARYRALTEHADAIGAEYIVTAHTADDQAETLLMRLGEGTGLRGLAGIPGRRDRIVRPWLAVSRRAVAAYAAAHGIPAVDDPSNADPRFLRNAVRQHVLPGIADCFGSDWSLRAAATADHARGAAELLDWLLARAPDVLAIDDDRAEARANIADLPPLARTALLDHALREAFTRWAPGHARRRAVHVARIDGLADGQRCAVPGGLVAHRRGDRIRIYMTPPAIVGGVALYLDGPGGFDWSAWRGRIEPGTRADPGPAIAFARDTAPFPWTLRTVRPADRMRPRGAPGHKSIRRLWSDRGIDAGLRPALPVIESAGRIIWAAGLRAAEHTRVAADAPAWRLTITPPPEAWRMARQLVGEAASDS